MAVRLAAAARPEFELSAMGGPYRNPRGVGYPALQALVEAVQPLPLPARQKFWSQLKDTGNATLALNDGALNVQALPYGGGLYNLLYSRVGKSPKGGFTLLDGRGTILP